MRALILSIVAGSLAAQSPTFVVDAASGPGTDFTSIQAAVLAVPDGSTLLVRPGAYSPINIDGKAITILADDGTYVSAALGVDPFLVVRNLLPNQAVTVRGLADLPSTAVLSATRLILENNAGPVTIDGDGETLSVIGAWLSGYAVVVNQCQQVTLRRWAVEGSVGQAACGFSNSSVVIEQCTIWGMSAVALPEVLLWTAEPGIEMQNAQVQLVQTRVFGGQGTNWVVSSPGAPAIQMSASSLRASGGSQGILGGLHLGIRAPSIAGTGVARVEPSIPLDDPPVGVTLTRPTMPSLLVDSALPGGVITATRYGEAGLACIIAVSLRGPTLSLPGIADPIWCEATSLVVAAAGVSPVVGNFTASLNVPVPPSMRGFAFIGQAAEFDATGALAVSNPSPGFVR